MTLDEFIASVENDSAPPGGLSGALKALWYAEKGTWKHAHEIAQDIPGREGSWVHANLHREEGDLGNARYWYARAGQPESSVSPADERREIVQALLDR